MHLVCIHCNKEKLFFQPLYEKKLCQIFLAESFWAIFDPFQALVRHEEALESRVWSWLNERLR